MLSGSRGISCVWLDAGSKMLVSKVRSHRKLEEVVFVFTYCNSSFSNSNVQKSVDNVLKSETEADGVSGNRCGWKFNWRRVNLFIYLFWLLCGVVTTGDGLNRFRLKGWYRERWADCCIMDLWSDNVEEGLEVFSFSCHIQWRQAG